MKTLIKHMTRVLRPVCETVCTWYTILSKLWSGMRTVRRKTPACHLILGYTRWHGTILGCKEFHCGHRILCRVLGNCETERYMGRTLQNIEASSSICIWIRCEVRIRYHAYTQWVHMALLCKFIPRPAAMGEVVLAIGGDGIGNAVSGGACWWLNSSTTAITCGLIHYKT